MPNPYPVSLSPLQHRFTYFFLPLLAISHYPAVTPANETCLNCKVSCAIGIVYQSHLLGCASNLQRGTELDRP